MLTPDRIKQRYRWSASDLPTTCIPIQDPTHLGTEFRVRIRRREKGAFLPLGNKIASCSDLEALLACVSKDQHLLREGDLNLYDKMNYDAVERLCKPIVSELLRSNVPGMYKFPLTVFQQN